MLLIILLLLVSMASWVYRDAKRGGVPYAVGWSLLTFLGGIPGLVIYLVVTRLDVLDDATDETSNSK